MSTQQQAKPDAVGYLWIPQEYERPLTADEVQRQIVDMDKRYGVTLYSSEREAEENLRDELDDPDFQNARRLMLVKVSLDVVDSMSRPYPSGKFNRW